MGSRGPLPPCGSRAEPWPSFPYPPHNGITTPNPHSKAARHEKAHRPAGDGPRLCRGHVARRPCRAIARHQPGRGRTGPLHPVDAGARRHGERPRHLPRRLHFRAGRFRPSPMPATAPTSAPSPSIAPSASCARPNSATNWWPPHRSARGPGGRGCTTSRCAPATAARWRNSAAIRAIWGRSSSLIPTANTPPRNSRTRLGLRVSGAPAAGSGGEPRSITVHRPSAAPPEGTTRWPGRSLRRALGESKQTASEHETFKAEADPVGWASAHQRDPVERALENDICSAQRLAALILGARDPR